MLKLVNQRKVKENWETYKEQIKTAMVSTDGGLAYFDGDTKKVLKWKIKNDLKQYINGTK